MKQIKTTTNPIIRYVDNLRNVNTHNYILIFILASVLISAVAVYFTASPYIMPTVFTAYIPVFVLLIAYCIVFFAIEFRLRKVDDVKEAQREIENTFFNASELLNQKLPVPNSADECAETLYYLIKTAKGLREQYEYEHTREYVRCVETYAHGNFRNYHECVPHEECNKVHNCIVMKGNAETVIECANKALQGVDLAY